MKHGSFIIHCYLLQYASQNNLSAIKMRATKTSKSPAKNILDKRFSLIDNERKFKRACEQILQLNQRMDEMQFRYTKAKKANHRSFRYNLRLRLAVIEGLRNMYYDYAHHKAEAVADLRRELFGEEVEIVTDDMSDSEMEDWTQILRNGALFRATHIFRKEVIQSCKKSCLTKHTHYLPIVPFTSPPTGSNFHTKYTAKYVKFTIYCQICLSSQVRVIPR